MLLARYITTLFGQQASELISEAEAVCGSDRGGGGGGGVVRTEVEDKRT